MDKKDLVQVVIIILMFVSGIYLYPLLPPNMPIHWGPDGRPDGYGSKGFAVVAIPLLTLLVYLGMTFIPYIMVYKENFKKFEKYYNDLKLMLVLFFLFLYIFMIIPNFGVKLNMNYVMVPIIAVLFYYIGHIMPKFKRNYFIGIRTPWTLASSGVWEKTHEKGAMWFKTGGLFFLVAAVFNEYFFWIIIGYVFILIVFLFVYSYIMFKKEGDKIEKEVPKPKKRK